ncbi:MAG: HlyD family secretion protein [Lentisphaerota bacterium]
MMAESQSTKEHKELLLLKGKLNAVSAVLKLGHESFEKHTLQQLANHIVNNSRMAAPYERSALIDMRGSKPRIIAVSGQPDVNANSEYCINLANLIQPFDGLDKVTVLTDDLLKEKNARQNAFEAFEYFKACFPQMLLIPVRPSSHGGASQELLIWAVEFSDSANLASAGSLLPLLCQHYGEALFFTLHDKQKIIHRVIDRKKWLKPSRVLSMLAGLFFISLFVMPVRQNVAADFEIMPGKENYYYAPFDGVIETCYNNKSGNSVVSGNIILSYNTEERAFELAGAENARNKISAQLDLIEQQSFKDISKRGEVRMLELQKEKAGISIKRNKWFLEKSSVRAKQPGILDIADKDKLEGKAVRAGEKLFEILSTENLIALIALNEQNASVLDDNCEITLYLHTMPEMPITGKIESISPKPVLTEKKIYCYMIRMTLDYEKKNLLCGMRGVARIAGPRVPLGYYLFRNLVLWWRRV